MISPDLEALGLATAYLVTFAVIFVESGLLVGIVLPGDTVLFTAGLLAGRHDSALGLIVLVVGVFLAAVLGDSLGYGIGARLGRPYLERRLGGRTPRLLERADRLYARHGWFAIVIARWIPWIRTIVPTLAGVGRMRYPAFLVANAIGAVLWAVGLTVLGYAAHWIPGVHTLSMVAMGVAIVAIAGYALAHRRRARRTEPADGPGVRCPGEPAA